MPLVPAVTELIIAQLLWLQYDNPEKDINIYINSIGTVSEDGQKRISFETEAYAISDTIDYIRPQVNTIAIGRCWGQAAMLLARGEKGKRYALPHASIKLHAPRINPAQGVISDVAIKAEEALGNAEVYVDMIARATGRKTEQVWSDIDRPLYLTPQRAVEYGLIDSVLVDGDAKADKRAFENALKSAAKGSSRNHFALQLSHTVVFGHRVH